MIVGGLTGGIGSGKTTVAKEFKKQRIPIFDSDHEVRKIYKKKDKQTVLILKKIQENITIVNKKGVNKKEIGNIIFKNPKKRKMLEKVIFNKLKKLRTSFLNKNRRLRKKIVLLDVPLLFENNINSICDYTIVTQAPKKLRMKRVLQRRGMTKNRVRKIMKTQLSEKQKTKLADFVLETNRGKWYTTKKIKEVLKTIYLKKGLS